MTQEGAKKWAKEIQALAEGKTIQSTERTLNKWRDANDPCFSYQYEYRIKPESKIIPFDSRDAKDIIGKAVIMVKTNETTMVLSIDYKHIVLSGYRLTFKEFLQECTFLDGSPCGKVVE